MVRRNKIIIAILLFIIVLTTFGSCSILNNISKTPSKKQSVEMYSKYDYFSTETIQFISPETLEYYPERTTGGNPGFARFFKKSPNAPIDDLPKKQLKKEDFSDMPSAYSLYWLGHSSAIFEIAAKRIIIDPVIENAAPFPYITRRFSSSPISRSEFPHIDIVLITHDHYDHLEMKTIKELNKKNVTFIVPLGVGTRIANWGVSFDKIKELDWSNSITFDGLKITACPMIHYSGRSKNDKNKTLWNGYIIKSEEVNIFWSGDSGYGEHFKEIGEKYGPFDLACIEIDGWNEGWPNTHLFPDEVIKVCQDINAKTLFPVHWGVFDLALHPWKESIDMIWNLAKQNHIDIIAPIMGEKVLPSSFVSDKWWNEIN